MELKDTVDGMLSKDYKERFIAEYNQAVIRRDKLFDMLDKYINKTLCFTPKSNIKVLIAQLDTLNTYVALLEIRAEYEGIEL